MPPYPADNPPDLERQASPPRIRDIVACVREHYGVTHWGIVSHRRGVYIRPRHVAMALVRDLTPHSFPEIGRWFDRDHTTVMSAVARIDHQMRKDPQLAWDMWAIEEALGK